MVAPRGGTGGTSPFTRSGLAPPPAERACSPTATGSGYLFLCKPPSRSRARRPRWPIGIELSLRPSRRSYLSSARRPPCSSPLAAPPSRRAASPRCLRASPPPLSSTRPPPAEGASRRTATSLLASSASLTPRAPTPPPSPEAPRTPRARERPAEVLPAAPSQPLPPDRTSTRRWPLSTCRSPARSWCWLALRRCSGATCPSSGAPRLTKTSMGGGPLR
mmetsp:Transcript_86671/g.172981  ORF Transcript_86671/g.172981 Transcript_86671/m.172981 type:complete len:219 (-) Transcript_86671:698-1354(-)